MGRRNAGSGGAVAATAGRVLRGGYGGRVRRRNAAVRGALGWYGGRRVARAT